MSVRLYCSFAWLVAGLGGCGPATSMGQLQPSSAKLGAVPAAAAAPASGAPAPIIRERPEWRTYFESERASGTVALFDSTDGSLSCSDVQKCKLAVIPASTFKIVNTLIALETGVVEDSETALPWDGTQHPIAEWNQDNTVRSAVRVSCVPCFQHIARQIGEARMRDWVQRLNYGNADTDGGIDRFWLSGELRISAIEQIDFLRRLERGTLPVQARSLEIVRDVLTLDVGRDHVLCGKTGLSRPPDVAAELGWFVGWVELGERRAFFATLVDGHAPEVDLIPLRRRLTERLLRDQRLLPD
ncbi:MAG TPA: penicillin-binding transpeptidase domain-containing protein [Polyangiaceae bacterium]|nr:penicillin-binding transpeptidase domain-containing protein [Polyangiaceae bacterium]